MKSFKKIKNNMFCKEKINQKKGVALLYAVMLSSIILAITLGVVNVSLKEIKFSTESRNTNDAFFAADVGAECALYYDNLGYFSSPQAETNIECNGNPIPITITGSSPSWFYDFIITRLGDSQQGCSIIKIEKTNSPTTKIISKGYNNGSDPSGQCYPQNGINTVERQLEVSY